MVKEIIRYLAAATFFLVALFWHGAEPLDLDMTDIQVTEGRYFCGSHAGGRGTSYPDIVNEIYYFGGFGYVFGITSRGACWKELSGQTVRIYYLTPKNRKERLLVELIAKDSGIRYGVSREKRLLLYKKDIEDKFWFYLTKSCFMLLGLYLIFANFAKKFFSRFFGIGNNHGNST